MEPQKTLYIHAGMSKAGSTSIQNMFYHNRDYFGKQGIYYPFTGKVNCHHDLPTIYTYRRHMDGRRTDNFIEILKEEINDIKPDKCLLSSEHFYHVLDKKEVAEVIKDIFGDYEIKIIVYIRRADKWLPSAYKQQIMGLRYRELDKIFRYTDHIERLFGIKDVFGIKNHDIIIRPFEKKQFYENNLLKDFLNIIDVEDPDNISGKSHPDNVKTNLNLDVIEYVRQMSVAVNNLEPSELTAWRNLFADYPCSKEHEDVSLFGSYENLEDTMNCYAPMYEQIAREYLSREDGKMFYDEPPPDKDHFRGYPGLTIEKIARINGYLNYKIRQEYIAEIKMMKDQVAEIKAMQERTFGNIIVKSIKKATGILSHLKKSLDADFQGTNEH